MPYLEPAQHESLFGPELGWPELGWPEYQMRRRMQGVLRTGQEEETTREPSRLPSDPPLGEREVDAAAPRDGDLFVLKLQSRSLNAYI